MKRRPQYVRIYARVITFPNKLKGCGYQVKYRKGFNRKVLSKLIAHTVNKMKYEKKMPVHVKGQTFGSFLQLFRSPWIDIRKLLDYDVKMVYD